MSSVWGLRRLTLSHVIEAAREFNQDNMWTYAAALAYSTLLAIFPFILFVVALVGFLGLPQLFSWLQEQAALLVPQAAMDPINHVIGELRTPPGGLLSIGIVIAVYSASAGVLSMMDALNAAYDVTEHRAAWKRMILALVYTLALAAFSITAAALMVIGPQIAGWFAGRLGIGELFVHLWTWLRWPMVVLLLMFTVSLVYFAGPDTRSGFRFVTPGAALSVIVWIATSIGFGIYVTRFADYNATYGSLGAIVVVLLYFFLTAAVLLFGAELNSVIERESVRQPSGSEDPG